MSTEGDPNTPLLAFPSLLLLALFCFRKMFESNLLVKYKDKLKSDHGVYTCVPTPQAWAVLYCTLLLTLHSNLDTPGARPCKSSRSRPCWTKPGFPWQRGLCGCVQRGFPPPLPPAHPSILFQLKSSPRVSHGGIFNQSRKTAVLHN